MALYKFRIIIIIIIIIIIKVYIRFSTTFADNSADIKHHYYTNKHSKTFFSK